MTGVLLHLSRDRGGYFGRVTISAPRAAIAIPIYRSLHTPEPRNPQKVSKRSFRHFYGTPGREAREDLFETFWGFWERASGLLYMAVLIAIQERFWGVFGVLPKFHTGIPILRVPLV